MESQRSEEIKTKTMDNENKEFKQFHSIFTEQPPAIRFWIARFFVNISSIPKTTNAVQKLVDETGMSFVYAHTMYVVWGFDEQNQIDVFCSNYLTNCPI